MSDNYEDFLDSKRITAQPVGFEPGELHADLFDYQRAVTQWAIRRGRAALFQDCGLGKTFEQIEWAREIQRQTGGMVIIVAPLAVAEQTIEEAARFGTSIKLAEIQKDCHNPGIFITNYEKLHKFTASCFIGIVLDESSCLKGDGPLRKSVTEFGSVIPYRLACSATPSPNEYPELGNHAEFLGIMSMAEMLATFFVHDGGETSKWRLKGHAEKEYFKWISSWAVCQRKPSDLGYSDIGFELPRLVIHEVILDAGPSEGMLFALEARSLQERRAARRSSLEARVNACADMVNSSDEAWLVWCGLNDESTSATKSISGSVEVTGSDPVVHKVYAAKWFQGKISRDKLASCRQAEKTRTIKKNTTQLTEKEDYPNPSHTKKSTLKKSDSIYENGIKKINQKSKSIETGHPQSETQKDEINTPLSQNSETSSKLKSEIITETTQVSGWHRDFKNTGSLQIGTLQSLNHKEESALYAVAVNVATKEEADSTLIIATNQELYGGYCARPATSELENSSTIQTSCIEPQSTSEKRVLVSKGSIFGFGINLQICSNIAFIGLSDSYEEFYQCIRRCWRFGQLRPVNVWIFIASTETGVLSNIKRKQAEADRMAEEMVEHMKEFSQREIAKASERERNEYTAKTVSGNNWTAYLGDCVESIRAMPDNHFQYSIYSPPFGSLYTYSNSERDMGNSRNWDEFWTHYDFLVKELYRVMKPGRQLSFHCMTMPTSKQNNGYIGAHDFRGDLIRAHEKHGFIFHSEVTIRKNPVTAMQRTKALGLLHKTIRTNRVMVRQGFADYLVTMRKPGDAEDRITGLLDCYVGEELDKDFTKWCRIRFEEQKQIFDDREPMDFETFKSIQIWQRYADPVWDDIDPSDTLQKESAREQKDERHIAPLQLQVIRRGLQLWTEPGDLVLSPFGGIGSEAYVSVQMNRKAVICELKESYFKQACLNLRRAEAEEKQQAGLFDQLADAVYSCQLCESPVSSKDENCPSCQCAEPHVEVTNEVAV